MSDEIVRIVTPRGAFGASEDDDLIDALLRKLAVAIEGNDDEWSSKYGTEFENDVFMMHRFCWCEKDDCPWCAGCDCPESAERYYIDGVECTYDEWGDYYAKEERKYFAARGCDEFDKHRPFYSSGNKKYQKVLHEWLYDKKNGADAVNKHRTTSHDAICDYCTGKGIFAKYPPGRGAPNFWHKKSGLMVYWYKYIGRGVETVGKPGDALAMFQECLNSINP